MMQLDGDVARVFQHQVRHVREMYRLSAEHPAADAEECFSVREHLRTDTTLYYCNPCAERDRIFDKTRISMPRPDWLSSPEHPL